MGGAAHAPPRWRRRPLALEDQLVLRHGFMPADEDYDRIGTKEQATSCAGGWRSATQLSTITGRWATTKRAVDKSKQQPIIAR